MSEGPSSPKRIRIDSEDISSLSREELVAKLREQDSYIGILESKGRSRSSERGKGEDDENRESEEKLKQQNIEAARRENTLVLRLTNKEQELQDCLNQISEMKQAQTQSTAQLRSMLLDPALSLVFQRMSKEVDECKDKLKQTQNELSAWKFTPDSQTGKRLMAKCRMLLQENEELGKMIASGRTAKLEGEIALQKTLVQEMKKNQEELDEFVGELEEDVEGMQSMIYVLQQQLKEAKEQVTKLQTENEQLRTSLTSPDNDPGGKSIAIENSITQSPKPEASNDGNETAESAVNEPSPKELNHVDPERTNEEREEMEVDSNQLASEPDLKVEVKEEEETTWTSNTTERTVQQNHTVHSHILTADSTSCYESTDASNDGWSPRNSKITDTLGTEESENIQEKTQFSEVDDAQISDIQPVRNGVEPVRHSESEGDEN